jgi:serine/threonine protein kinase
MCTGEIPFKAPTISEIIKAHLYEEPLSPDKVNSRIPTTLSAVIKKALDKVPANRYRTALELSEAFSTCLPTPFKRSPPSDTVRISDIDTTAFLKSVSSGARYKLLANNDNRIGRSNPNQKVEVDLSSEKDSEFVHSIHAIVRFSTSGWEFEAPSNINNPIFINNQRLQPGERVILSNGDRITLSRTKLEVEI